MKHNLMTIIISDERAEKFKGQNVVCHHLGGGLCAVFVQFVGMNPFGSPVIGPYITDEETDMSAAEMFRAVTASPLFPARVDAISDVTGISSADGMTVVSNTSCFLGFSSIFCDGILSRLYEEVGDFYVLPSSIHEAIVVSKRSVMEVQKTVSDLLEIVLRVNTFEVNPGDVLVNDVFVYDHESGHLVSVTNNSVVTAA